MLEDKEILKLKKIGDTIRKERLRKNISQAAIAFEMKTSTKQFQRIENGEINTGVLNLFKISKIIGVSIDKIIK